MKNYRYFQLIVFLVLLLFAIQSLFYFNLIDSKWISDLFARKPTKYVLYECNSRELCGGLADRFKAVINAYVWSLITNRRLIVNISKPCNFVNLMIPNNVDWNLDLKQLVKSNKLRENFTLHQIRALDNFRFKDQLANIDILRFKNTTDVISLFANIEWISAYSRNRFVLYKLFSFYLIKLLDNSFFCLLNNAK